MASASTMYSTHSMGTIQSMQAAGLFTRAINAVRPEIKLHPRIYLAFQIIFFVWSVFWFVSHLIQVSPFFFLQWWLPS